MDKLSNLSPNSNPMVDLPCMPYSNPPQNAYLTIKLCSLDHADPGVDYILQPTDYIGWVRDDYTARLGYNRDEAAICLYREYAQSLHYDRSVADNDIKNGEVIIVLAMYPEINTDTTVVRFDIFQENMLGTRLYATRHRLTTPMSAVYLEWANHIHVDEDRVMLYTSDEFGELVLISDDLNIESAGITNH